MSATTPGDDRGRELAERELTDDEKRDLGRRIADALDPIIALARDDEIDHANSDGDVAEWLGTLSRELYRYGWVMDERVLRGLAPLAFPPLAAQAETVRTGVEALHDLQRALSHARDVGALTPTEWQCYASVPVGRGDEASAEYLARIAAPAETEAGDVACAKTDDGHLCFATARGDLRYLIGEASALNDTATDERLAQVHDVIEHAMVTIRDLAIPREEIEAGGEEPWLPMPVEQAIERLDRSTAADTISEHRHAVITLQNFARARLAATTPAPEGEAVRSWWVGWYGVGEFEYHGPWWVSGAEIGGAGRSTFVAAVRAADEAGARQVIAGAHDEPDPVIEWRFVEERPESWDPFGSDRFPRGDWMQWPAPAGPQAEGAGETTTTP